MTIGKKIRILRINREWTQATLAEKLNISPDTVQKWEVEKNTPPLAALKDIAQILDTSVAILSDDEMDIVEYQLLGQYDVFSDRIIISDSQHQVYYANLRRSAHLHRFINSGGIFYSSICIGSKEIWSCERKHEKLMIDAWNNQCPV
ncbi:helix-turn-helix transcriptional regulator [Proteiniclasticum sp. QWL-01]|uniref:helix-turn-helix domain-containing protein n=1 Tax=Proteiniclasticum sp. QWL-01 TaxID=3036945 RepID=UPI00240E9FB9|nr:helix-turn-helix transcriptional regulator [Proteiniclasticum sp. QWL-01]WFF71815.1 helix-turn-helix transcriptional regulator [Proteiniclasticum sp. QWL-01]